MKKYVILFILLLIPCVVVGWQPGSGFFQEFERTITFTVGDFTLYEVATFTPTSSTTPGFVQDNSAVAIEWAAAEYSKIITTFKVPEDYVSGGAFRVFADSTDNTTTTYPSLDFDVVVHTSGSPWATTHTGQTAVALSEKPGTPELVSLAVGTDFGSLAKGSIVTLGLWRDTSAATGELRVYYGEFYYNGVF